MIFQIEFECALKRNAQIKIKNGEKMKKIFTFAVIALLLIVHNSEARVLSFAEKPSNYIQLIDGINDKLLKYKNEIFVIGHKVPDTDTVCTAIVYANLKRHLGLNCKPMISGKTNNETKFVLTYWGIDVPEILTNASGKNIILVDHNVFGQSVDGMKEANIVEIIDHHNIGDIVTGKPIIFRSLPIGSAATVAYLQYLEQGVRISKKMAGLIISAILSDTNNLTLTTTTDTDKYAVENLKQIAEIANMDEYYSKMLEAALSYEGMIDEEIFFSDYKEYGMHGHKISISSILAKDEITQQSLCQRLLKVMENADNSIEHRYAFVIDKKNHKTELIYSGNGAEEKAKKAFKANSEGKIIFNFDVSRKLDIVPPLTEAYKQ